MMNQRSQQQKRHGRPEVASARRNGGQRPADLTRGTSDVAPQQTASARGHAPLSPSHHARQPPGSSTETIGAPAPKPAWASPPPILQWCADKQRVSGGAAPPTDSGASSSTTQCVTLPPLRGPPPRSTLADVVSQRPPHHVVVVCPGSGQFFDVLRHYVLRHLPDWVDGGDAMYKRIAGGSTEDEKLPSIGPSNAKGAGRQQSAAPSARGGGRLSGGGSSSTTTSCCHPLRFVSLFLGDKKTTEQLVSDTSAVVMRERRRSIAAAATKGGPVSSNEAVCCSHQKTWLGSTFPLATPSTSWSTSTLANYIPGLKCITLKSRMVKTLQQSFRGGGGGASELASFLPVTFQLTPHPKFLTNPAATRIMDEREQMVAHMCQCNVESFERSGEIATYWIAKASHGAHGSNIRIFFADQDGLNALMNFIDTQHEPYPWVVSRYIDRPLLYHGRKFDIRVWVLITPTWDVYLHRELVMRMSSEKYNRKNLTTDNPQGRLANITNHCIQAEGKHYSEFEQGNELWRDTLDALVQRRHAELVADSTPTNAANGKSGLFAAIFQSPTHPAGVRVPSYLAAIRKTILATRRTSSTASIPPEGTSCIRSHHSISLDTWVVPQIKFIVQQTLVAARPHLLPCCSTSSAPPPGTEGAGAGPTVGLWDLPRAFQLMGYDFLIDEQLIVWLLEVNGSPGVAQARIDEIARDTAELVIRPQFPAFSAASSGRWRGSEIGGPSSAVSANRGGFDYIFSLRNAPPAPTSP